MTPTLTCQACGTPIKKKRAGPWPKWCSDRCRRSQYKHPCPDCGGLTGADGDTVRCRACAGRYQREMTKRWMVESLAEWVDLFGVPPTATDWNPQHARAQGQHWKADRHAATGRPWPSVNAAQDHYGSWAAFLRNNGFDVFESGRYGRDGDDPEIVAETIRLYRSGLSSSQVGERLGVTGFAILCRLKTAGEPRRTPSEAQQLRAARERETA